VFTRGWVTNVTHFFF